MERKAVIAEAYLQLIPTNPGYRHDGIYVRLAYGYGVPFGRIVNLTGLPAEVVAAYLEGEE